MSRYPLIISFSLLGLLAVAYFVFPAFHDSLHEGFHVLTSNDEKLIEAWVSRFGLFRHYDSKSILTRFPTC